MEELIKRAQKGDKEVFIDAVNQHYSLTEFKGYICELPPLIEVDGFVVNTTTVASLPTLSRSLRPL